MLPFPKAVTASHVQCHEANKPIQCISVSKSQRIVAMGCSSELVLVRLEPSNNSHRFTDMCAFSEPTINSLITDVSWSPHGPHDRVAHCYSSGHIVCLNVNDKASRQSQILSLEWNSGKISSGINRISWHPTEPSVIASANQDGIVRIFDFRFHSVAASVTSFGKRGFVATRDIQFNPFHTDIFAEVSDNGTLQIWDRRMQNKPLLMKPKAHDGAIMTVTWSPCWEWVLATGSKDRTIRLWDLGDCGLEDVDSILPMSAGEPVVTRPSSSSTSSLAQLNIFSSPPLSLSSSSSSASIAVSADTKSRSSTGPASSLLRKGQSFATGNSNRTTAATAIPTGKGKSRPILTNRSATSSSPPLLSGSESKVILDGAPPPQLINVIMTPSEVACIWWCSRESHLNRQEKDNIQPASASLSGSGPTHSSGSQGLNQQQAAPPSSTDISTEGTTTGSALTVGTVLIDDMRGNTKQLSRESRSSSSATERSTDSRGDPPGKGDTSKGDTAKAAIKGSTVGNNKLARSRGKLTVGSERNMEAGSTNNSNNNNASSASGPRHRPLGGRRGGQGPLEGCQQ